MARKKTTSSTSSEELFTDTKDIQKEETTGNAEVVESEAYGSRRKPGQTDNQWKSSRYFEAMAEMRQRIRSLWPGVCGEPLFHKTGIFFPAGWGPFGEIREKYSGSCRDLIERHDRELRNISMTILGFPTIDQWRIATEGQE